LTYKDLLNKGIKDIDDRFQSVLRLLLLAYCQQAGIDLYSEYENTVDLQINEKFEKGLLRIIDDEPLAYILGYEPFYGYDIICDPRALIPRPETEELVNEVLMLLDERESREELYGLDLGTGSGAIAVVLALEDSRLRMVASDISEAALSLAKENAERFNVSIDFIQSDLFTNIPESTKFDFIVCNPPYIKERESVERSVLNFEPHTALFGGEDGTYFYREILKKAKDYLKPQSFLAFEIAYDQGEILKELATSYFQNSEILLKKDINEKDRFLIIITN